MVPFLICAGCFLIRLRNHGFSKQNEKQNPATTTRHNLKSSSNNHNDNNTYDNDSVFEDNGTSSPSAPTDSSKARNASAHEGVYFTNEPLDMYTRN
jgi:hypothetical protein